MECSVTDVVTARTNRLRKDLTWKGKPVGTITVRSEQVMSCREKVELRLMGRNLEKKVRTYAADDDEPSVCCVVAATETNANRCSLS